MNLFWTYSITGIFISCAIPFAGLALLPFYLVHDHYDRKEKQRLARLSFKYAMQARHNWSTKS